MYFTSESLVEVHPLDGNRKNNKFENLAIVHRHCHDQIHGRRKEISKMEGTHAKSQIS
jgi:hypothetical protein